MFIKQLSIFVENKTGRLHEIMETLATNNINISALSMADTSDFGVLRMIVDDVVTAKAALKEAGIISKVTNVMAVYVEDRAGGLASVLAHIYNAGIGVDYMYAFLGRTKGKALMVLRPDDMEKAKDIFEANGVKLAAPDEI